VKNMETTQQPRKPSLTIAIVVLAIVASLMAGLIIGYTVTRITSNNNQETMQNQISYLQQQISDLEAQQSPSNQNAAVITGENVSLAQIYNQVKDSVVVVQGITVQYNIFNQAVYSGVQGSGFVYNYNGKMVIITNNHVVQDTLNNTVTFFNGDAFTAAVIGSDPYADLAVLTTDAPASEYQPLQIVSSSTLEMGDPLIAVGGPYGLAGSMTTGVVSALGRTINEDTSSYAIANVIQTSAPINPGNSGGPLLNLEGKVIGITTAIVSNSQGLGFAIPADTVIREISALVTTGSYNQHPWLGAAGVDMNYAIAQALDVNVTYGWAIAQVTSGGPADQAGLKGGTSQTQVEGNTIPVGGDIVIALNGTRIRNLDDLSSFLEENTLPNQTINVTIVRDGQTMTLQLTLGARPAPS
jgi:S1-C subfamily serine protease